MATAAGPPMARMKHVFDVESSGKSDAGLVRELNEDRYLVKSESGLFVVADGMGGHDAGEVASTSIVEHLSSIGIPSSAPDLRARVEDRIVLANREIRQLSAKNGSTIGSTLAALLAFERQYACMWAGDSRIYMLHNGKLSQLSRDHTEMQELLDRGLLSPDEAAVWPRRNVVTRAIGAEDDPPLDIAHGAHRGRGQVPDLLGWVDRTCLRRRDRGRADRRIAGRVLRQPDQARTVARRHRQRHGGDRRVQRTDHQGDRGQLAELMSDTVTRVMLATRLETGTQLNDTYEIDDRIASGGMGEIYRGHNIQTGEPVAIKTILPELAEQEAIFALFKREATILGRLHHDTIVHYYTFSRDPRLGRPYLAMEFVDGVSLAERMKQQPLTAAEARKLFAGVADGLALAHGAGVVHRDLSPDNIILRGGDVGRPKIIDFGIAKSANVGEGTLIGGGFAGKYNFISPEQLGIHNREVDARSDIYCLGLVMAAGLRGRPLEMGGSHVDVIEKRSRLPDLSDIDETMRPLIEAMLQPDPDARPPTMADVAEWLRATRSADPTTAPVSGSVVAPANGAPGGQPTVPPTSTPWAKTKFQTGTPFSSEPTQPPRSQPPRPLQPTVPPASAAQPPSASESPFGPGPASAPAAAAPPGTLAIGDAAKERRWGGSGRLAMVAGLFVVLLGGGATAAYMSGMFDSGPVVPTPSGGTSETSTTQKETADTGPTAKSKEHEAIGDALEEAAKAEDAKAAQTAADGGPGSQTAETTQPTNDGNGSAEQVAINTPGDGGGDAVKPDNNGQSQQIEELVTEPDKEMKEAAAGLTKMMDVGVAWLHQYDGGKCFFVTVTSVTNKTINVRGFGPDAASFQTLYTSFMEANQIEPELNGQLINEAQCAAADFLKAVLPRAKGNPQLTLATDRVTLGDTLTATVDNAEGKVLDLLLVDDEGLVYNVKSLAAQTISDGKMTFEMWVGGLHIDKESPEMMIAITSKLGLEVPQGKDHARAAALFLKLARQIEEQNLDVGIDFAYFRAKP